jgi:multidrug efflux system outer membrane protein
MLPGQNVMLQPDDVLDNYEKHSYISMPHRHYRSFFHISVPHFRWLKPPLTGLLALMVCACASVPAPPVSPLGFDVPANWAGTDSPSAAAQTSLVDWWLRFNDPQLSMLIRHALVANTSIKGAQAALQQARALRDAAGASLWPTLGSSASLQRSRNGDTTGNNFRVGLDASWELDVFGANRSAVDASEAAARASAANLGDVQVSIAAEVALDYIALRSAQERMAIAQANLTNQQETLQLTQWRLQAGLVTTLEAEQARASAEQTAAQIPSLQTTISQTSHALSVLTSQPPAALLLGLAVVGPIPEAFGDLAMAFPADTLRQRSDVRAAELQVSAASARASQADAQRLPSFKLGGSLGLSTITLGALTNGTSVAAAVLASMSWPVLDGGAAQAQLRAQQAALAQAHATYQATVLTALTEVEDALVALRGDQMRLLRLQNAFASADIAANLASQRYGSGLVDFQTVLETQRTRLGTQDSVASVRAAVSADHIRLYKALGGGWLPSDANATAIPASPLPRTPNS